MTFSESEGVRYLHFGTPWIQGAMRIKYPHRLVLDYTQDMMAWLILLAAPKRLLQLGLGAGSCARFLLHHLPDTKQTVVELHQEVILANAIMFGTKSDASLSIIHDDANRFMASAKDSYWPVILADLYDADARGPACDGAKFYQNCYRSLAAPGLMVLNLFGSHASWKPNYRAISEAFGTEPLVLNPGEAGNVVVIASKGPTMHWPTSEQKADCERYLRRRAGLLKTALKLPTARWIKPIAEYLHRPRV
ncbi:MAG: spermidine synthase [Betaproteobacteria bacterium]|nr:spermidine synthase [Betaproteobacteria bacterium]